MKFIGQLLAFLLLLAVCILFVFVGLQTWKISVHVIEGAKTLKPNVYVPLTITILSAALGLSATLYTQARTRRREIEAAFRERKIAIYLDFLETIESISLAVNNEIDVPAPDQEELVIKLVKMRTKCVLWGSTGVLKALNDFTKVGAGNTMKMMLTLDNIQREMRKDLGLSNFALEKFFFTKLSLKSDEEWEKFKSLG